MDKLTKTSLYFPPFVTPGLGLILGEKPGLAAAGLFLPFGIGGKMDFMLDVGRLSDDGDTAAVG